MALKILKKAEKAEDKKLPEGADRFLWTEVPVTTPVTPAPIKKREYAEVLKFGQKAPSLTND